MVFDIYKIASKELTEHVQYILFNYCIDSHYSKTITSFANTNICLGIINGKKLEDDLGRVKYMKPQTGIHSYLSGMYMSPHKFDASGLLDEICIDFTPLGYYHFFKFPLKTYVFNEDVLSEGLGKDAKHFFEEVFTIYDFQKRGRLIERFLLKKLIDFKMQFLKQCLLYIHSDDEINLKQLSGRMQCSEKKIIRSFLSSFDLSPKEYMRIVKFRKALYGLKHSSKESLTSIAHQTGYYDQSHFIKDINFFTEKSPKQIRANVHNVGKEVIIGVE